MPATKEWGIYVYFAADVPEPLMQRGAWRTLETMASVGSNARVGITALMDLPGRDTEYYVIPERPTNPCVKRWPIFPDRFLPNVNSANIETIYEFFEWSHRNCPAKKIALIFWGHGYALDDFDPRFQESGSFAVTDQDDDGMGRTFERNAKSFPGKRGQELKLLYDSTHDSVLNNRDFAGVLRSYNKRFLNGQKMQVLGLDCCNMAMAEVLCEFQDCADYVIAAETGLPFQSWLSVRVLRKFLAAQHSTAEEFAEHAVRDFIQSFGRLSSSYVGLSACNLNAFKDLEVAVKKLASALYVAVDEPENRAAVEKAWFSDVSFIVDGLIDLSSFCMFLQRNLPGTDVASAALGVMRAVKKVVILSKTAPDLPGRKICLSKGLSFWFPPWIQHPAVDYFQIEQSKDYFVHGYPQTRFARATGWDKFLGKLLQLTQS
jgi:hypothetical protein